MTDQSERFWYPFTASTVLARRIVPLLLFTLGIGLFLWAGREYYFWRRPWAILPEAALGVLAWVSAGYFFTLLPEVRADDRGLRVRRWGLVWRRIPWDAVARVRQTAQVDLLGWVESFYTVYVWRTGSRQQEPIRRAFRFSGHIRNCDQLLTLIQEEAEANQAKEPNTRT